MTSDPHGRPPAQILSVTGGQHGVAASYAAARRLAAHYDDAAGQQRSWAEAGGRLLVNLDLLESDLLSPATGAVAEAAVLAATAGPHGLLVDSLHWETDAIAIRATVRLFEETDHGVRLGLDLVDYDVDRALGFGLVRLPFVLPLVAAVVSDDDAVTGHPWVVENVVNGGGGLLDGMAAGLGLPLLTPTEQDGAGLLDELYGGQGKPVVGPVDVEVDDDTVPPDSIYDLIHQLDGVAGLSPGPRSPLNGTIEVQTITAPDGTVRYVVYLPGTDDMATLPWTEDGDVRDMHTNLGLIDGHGDAYQQGILQALHDAGVQPGDPIAIVGHSQGGMEAAALAAGDHHLHVTDVVTAGSPTAQVGGFPDGVQVLSLEQQGDVVPLLDGHPNPDSVQQTTVVFDGHPDPGVAAHHSYPTYESGAHAVDASSDPSVQADVQHLHEGGYLGGGPGVQVTSQVFQITRG